MLIMTTTTTTLTDSERRKQLDESTITGEQFYKVYYEAMDKRRQLVWKMYMDTGVLTWNGNVVNTNEEIRKFFETLPPTSYQINTLDAQPLSVIAVGNRKTHMVQTSGIVTFRENTGKSFHSFNQTFIITAVEDKWKIVSDIFRTAKST